MTPAAFAAVAGVHLLAAMSPGPAFVLSVRTAAQSGFAPAAGLALGFGLGAAIWAGAALTGLSILFDLVPPLYIAIKILGGLFLIWLAIQLWRGARDPKPDAPAEAPRGRASVLLGLATQLANPKPAVFFGAVFVGLVPAAATTPDKALVVANILWMEAAWYLIVARVFSAPRARGVYWRLRLWLDRSMAVILGGLGLRVAI